MKIKKIAAFALALMLIVGAIAVPASATTRDVTDEYFDGWAGYVYKTSDTFYVDQRVKENATSIYIYNYSEVTLKVRGEGWNGKQWVNETCGAGSATVPQGEYFIETLINEHGESLARLAINSAQNYGKKRYVYGKWSPDSVGSYPVAND